MLDSDKKADLGIAGFTVMNITVDYAFILHLAFPQETVRGSTPSSAGRSLGQP